MSDETRQNGAAGAASETAQAEPAPGAKPEAAPAQPDPIETLKSENADLRDRLLRTVAEMENLRKRAEREVKDAGQYAISRFAHDLLGVGAKPTETVASILLSNGISIPGTMSFRSNQEYPP